MFLLAVWVCGLAGCIVVRENNYERVHNIFNVEFAWRLAGLKCANYPEVSTIRLRIPGRRLMEGGLYACAGHGIYASEQAVMLTDFSPGPYDYVIEALDMFGCSWFSESGSFYVDGVAQVTPVYVDLLKTHTPCKPP